MKNLPILVMLCLALTARAQGSDSSSHYYQLGVAEMEAKRYLVASRNFEKALQFDPSNVNTILQSSFTFLEMRKLNMALEGFKKVHELQPGNQVAIEQLMQLYFNYRQYQNAIEMAKKCKSCADAKRIIGLSEYHLENFPNAEKQLKAALEENGNDAEVAYTLGRNYLDMEQYNKAVPYYEKAVLIDPTKSMWMYELALLYYNISDYRSSVTMFNKAAAAGYVQSNDFKENYGFAALYAGQTELGEQLINDIIKRKPGNTSLLRSIAEVLYQQKQYDRSLNYCQQLLEKDPNDGKALYQAGLNFIKKGQKDRGQQMCDKAIEMDPSLQSLRRKKEMMF